MPDPKPAAATAAAVKLEEKAEDAALKAEALAAEAQAAAEKAEDDAAGDRVPRCPDCRERMEPYTGDNAWKLNTAFCHHCGRRRQVRRNRVVD